MPVLANKLGASWEIAYPPLVGVCGAAAGYVYGPKFLAMIVMKGWAIENTFVAVFTLATVAAGFGLTIYTFLLTTESGFIGRAKRSIYYRHLLTYVLNATVLSGVTALVTIAGMIIKDAPSPNTAHAAYVGISFGLTLWSSSALFRAGRLFTIFAQEHH